MEIKFRVGDTVRVAQKIVEGEKSRLQIFEGTVVAINHNAKSYTVRKVTDGVGVERIWPFETPWVESVTVKKSAGKVRRAKLYYLRGLTAKEAGRATR